MGDPWGVASKSGGDPWGVGGSGGAKKNKGKGKKKPSLLGQVKDFAGQIPRGVVGLAGEAGTEAATALNLDTDSPGALLKSLVVGKELKPEEKPKGAAETILAFAGANPRQGAKPGETPAETMRRTRPFSAGTADSFGRTLGDLRHPSNFKKASDEGTIVGKILEDVANLGGAGRLVSRAAAPVAAGTGRLAPVGRAVEKAGNVASAPGRAVATTARKTAKAGYQALAAGDGRVGDLIRLARLDPDSRLLRREAIEPATEAVSVGVGEAVKRGQAVAKVLPDLDEQRAMTLVGEGEAAALAKLRAHLPTDQFTAHVASTYGDSVPLRAVELAADVVDGKAPDLAGRIDEGLRLGRELEGGRAARAADYVAALPSREAQRGFDPLPEVVERRLAPLEKTRPRVEREALGARATAERAAARLAEVEGRPGPELKRPTAGLESAAVRVETARARLAEAKAAAAAAEEKIMRTAQVRAERAARSGLRADVDEFRARAAEASAADEATRAGMAKAERAARSALRTEVLEYRRRAAAHARATAADMEDALAGLLNDSPAPPPKGSANYDLATELREGLGPQFVNRRLFSARSGIDLDVWLEQWNNRRNVVPEITSAADYSAVAADVVAHFRAIRELRSAANGVVSRGAEGAKLSRLMEDPEADPYLRGTPDEAVGSLVDERGPLVPEADAVARLMAEPQAGRYLEGTPAAAVRALADERGPLAPDAGSDALAATYDRIDAGGKLRPLERRIAAPDRLAPRVARAESKLDTTRDATTSKLLAAGQRSALPLGRAQQAARITENVARSAETRRASLSGRIESARRDVEYSLEAAPARLRPVLKANRQAATLLTQQENRLRGQGLHEAAKLVGAAADELPTTLARLKAAGVDFEHFTHIKLDAKPTSGGPTPGALPKIRKGRESRQRKGSTTYNRTVRAQTQAEIDTVKIAVARQAVDKIATLPFAKRFDSIEAATKEGYVAWDSASPFEKSGAITRTTVFVPEKLFVAFRSYFNDPAWDKFLKRTYDPAIQAFKITVLPLSPSWQVGNVFGNALLAMVGGGVGPADLAKQLTRAVKAYRQSGPRGERSFESVGPRRLYSSGPTHEEFSFLRPPDEQVLGTGKPSRALRAIARPGAYVVRKSYALNGFVDDLGRSAVYLSKLEKGSAPDAALRQALKAMGDFSRLTPFERRFVRRVIPFYAWQRHLTQLAFALPLENPLRTAWILHLADQYGTDESLEDLPEFLRGAVPLPGGKLLGTRGLNPFSQVGGPVFNPDDVAKSISPLLKIPYEQTTGLNTFTGRPFTRPDGTADLDEFGRELPTAPSLLKRITDISPQKRLLESLSGRGGTVRYDTGDQVITKTGPIETEKTPLTGLARFLGFPITSRTEAERIAAAVAEKEAEAKKRREAYERRRDAAQR